MLATAFQDNKEGRVVLVIINNAHEDRAVNVRLSGVRVAGKVTGEQSYGERRWQPLRPFLVESPERIRTVVPALSVTTLAAPGQADPQPGGRSGNRSIHSSVNGQITVM